jgi:probable phosphomutase (TIGR03848 family)
MTLVLVVRHGLTASTGKALTGWLPGIPLDDRGITQAGALAARLAKLPLAAVVSSPLERCMQTAGIIAGALEGSEHSVKTDDRLGECRYGDWSGKPLRELAKDPLWRVVQAHPSAVRFPGEDGESMTGMQQRAIEAVRDWNDKLGSNSMYVLCSHGDVIKAILADALGMHLDMLQRIQVDPCSLSIVRYTPLRPFVLRMNDTGADVSWLARKPEEGKHAGGKHQAAEHAVGKHAEARRAAAEADAQVGGGAGSLA